MNKLSPEDPNTSRTIILSAYSTWHTRTLRKADSLNPGLEGPENEDEEEMNVSGMTTLWPETCSFERIVMDEAHYVKNL